ncbi:hypothetical protein B0H14DRAFT_3880799, partial [Mycena olivaceomarginata]
MVEPLLYRIVFLLSHSSRRRQSSAFGFPTFIDHAFQQRPSPHFQRVKYLLVGVVGTSVAEGWLNACRGVTNLFFQANSTSGRVLRALGSLHEVQYLTIDVLTISCADDTLRPLFLNVTHLEPLELYDTSSAEADRMCANLALIPHLTHVAFNLNLQSWALHAGLPADLRLQCIVFLVPELYELDDSNPLLADSRFVCIHQALDYDFDWLSGAVTGDDYWVLADAFLATRRAGTVWRSQHTICDQTATPGGNFSSQILSINRDLEPKQHATFLLLQRPVRLCNSIG